MSNAQSVFLRGGIGVREPSSVHWEACPERALSGLPSSTVTACAEHSAFGKIASRADIEDEERRFQQFVSVHLDPACVPVLAGHVLSGAGRQAALYYSLADRFDRCVFDVLAGDEAGALEVLTNLQTATQPWYDTGMTRDVLVGDLRRLGISDDVMSQNDGFLNEYDWRSIEARQFSAPYGPQHGDLHGKNVLVDPTGQVMLIDFGDVERYPLGLDPIVLELSLLFHPDRPQTGVVPSVAACRNWADVEEFASTTGFPLFVRACRAWAMDVAGEYLMLCIAYAHAVRQFKYPETDKALAGAIANAALARLEELG